MKQIGTGTGAEKSIYTADGQLLIRYGGTDGASLFLGDTILRTKASVTTGVRSYVVAGVAFAERVSGTGGGLWWSSADTVGTVGLEINAVTGQVVRRWMDPFGQARGTAVAWSSPLGYLNKPASSTGITQLGARAYDPGLGRFLTVDPKLDTADPRHANAYAYSFNSPVSFSDADGLAPYNPGPPIYQAPKGPSVATSLPTPIIVSVPPSGAPPSAGNGGNGGGSPAPAQEVQWWNPFTWDHDAWVTAGEAALTIGAVIAVGACVVATAGICAGVGMVGGLVLAGAASGTISLAGYELKTGPKTGEGALTAFTVGGLSGMTSFGIGFATPLVANAATSALKSLVSTAGTKAAPAIESAASATVSGGIGPVLKGQAGVNQVAAAIESSGGKILGREITVEANGVRTRPDLFVEDACGNRCFVEVKNGPSAGLTKNQSLAFTWIQSQGFIPRGANAAAAGLTPGMAYGPMPVRTVKLP